MQEEEDSVRMLSEKNCDALPGNHREDNQNGQKRAAFRGVGDLLKDCLY